MKAFWIGYEQRRAFFPGARRFRKSLAKRAARREVLALKLRYAYR